MVALVPGADADSRGASSICSRRMRDAGRRRRRACQAAPGRRRHRSATISPRSSRREHEADDITREVLQDVRRVFVTPFDRSAITDLIGVMDDAIDQMNGTAKSIELYEVTSFEPQMRDMAGIIVEAARVTAEAIPLLRSLGQQCRPPARSDRAADPDRRPCRRYPRCRPEGAVQGARQRPRRWISSSAAKSTAISKGSSTGSRMSRTRSRAS